MIFVGGWRVFLWNKSASDDTWADAAEQPAR